MYTAVLVVHSYVRWVVLVMLLIALFRALGGLRTRRAWTPADEATSRSLVGAMDLQFLLGLALYAWLSPITLEAFRDFGSAMRDTALRFFAVEHLAGMIIAIALTHIGRSRIGKTTDPARRHRLALIFYGLALLVALGSIPWPGMRAGRVLFRGLGI